MTDGNDYYAILGVPADADPALLKQAYRALVRRWHPDVRPTDPEAPERFHAITTAYQTLREPAERRRYDAARPAARAVPRTAAWSAPFDDGPQGRGAARSSAAPSTTVEDLLATLLAGRAAPFPSRQRGGAALRTVTLSLEEAFRGTVRRLHLNQGMLTIALPRGVATGDCFQIIPSGAAVDGAARLRPLTVRVLVLPHPRFQRVGDDLWLRLRLDPAAERSGGPIRVPLLDRNIVVTVPPGLQREVVVQVRQGGMPHLGETARCGDLYVQLCREAERS